MTALGAHGFFNRCIEYVIEAEEEMPDISSYSLFLGHF